MNVLRDPLTIVTAMAMLVAEDERWRLVIVGEGPLRGEVIRCARELGIERRVTLLGNRQDIADLHRAFDMYVNVAPCEAFGIAVVEAMQSRLPVVVSDVGGLPELVEDGVSGVLVRPGDPRALTSALRSIEDDRAWAEALGASARQRALRLFAAERFAADRVVLLRAAAACEAVVDPRYHPV
jgi:glycosyltransferase involved in cell wall biosynthesis